jgi:3',5'-cyclic AMP phosphodiesterase CpdA
VPWFSLLARVLGVALVVSWAAPTLAAQAAPSFTVGELLMTPTATSVTLRLVPAEDVLVAVRWGLAPGPTLFRTSTTLAPAGEAVEFVLRELQPASEHVYVVDAKPADAPGPLIPREPHGFSTLPPPGSAFRFAYATDSHHYESWADSKFKSTHGALNRFQRTMDNVRDADPLFLVIGGDFVQTQCDCAGGAHDGQVFDEGSAKTVDEALRRYHVTFGPEGYGPVVADVPAVYVLGNHDGEAGFDTPNAQAVMAASRPARQATLANPSHVYPGDADGTYYAFESGDALIVVLDVMGHTPVKPAVPGDWTLGPEQLAWLGAVLEASEAHWTLIFAEHLVGGEKTPTLLGASYWYGRGGLRATVGNQPDGAFKGEQSLIQLLQEQDVATGGHSVFLTGHDHVAIAPMEKPAPDGAGTRTWHLKGGRAGYKPPSWANIASFKVEMDQDLSGVVDYDEPEIGSREPGFFLIDVRGAESLTFRYVITDLDDPERNGSVAFSRTISSLDPGR